MADADSKPTLIGGFEILEKLGQGGMGAVFKARQISMDRVVALKILPPNLADNEAYVQRFIREARSAAKLNHPNIVQGIDVGEASGHYYFAMEFVDGTTVRDMLRQQTRLHEKAALNIIGAVARALEHAREHGIIHRDIKPDNIMVTRKGAVKLADLGLARSTEKPDTMTIEGTTLGTPYYMAPEQVRGTTELDTRADIYSLGATLYHMVTGEFAYDGPNAGAIMARHLAEPVPSAREQCPEVSRATDELIQRMMAKDPADRPQTPTELLAEIRDALAGKVHLRAKQVVSRQKAVGRQRSGPLPPGEGRVRGGRNTAYLVAGLTIVVLFGIIIGLVAVLRPGSKPPDTAISVPDHQPPTTEHLLPSSAQHPAASAALAALHTQLDALIAKDQFGDALSQVAAFVKDNPTAADEGRKLTSDVLAKAKQRFEALALAADAAAKARQFDKARDALKPADAFGIPALADQAKAKLDEIDSREKSAEAWAKWDEVKTSAAALADGGKFTEALAALDMGKDIALPNIAALIAEQTAAIDAARRKAAEAALAAYAKESDKLWTLFKARKYPEAEALLSSVARRSAADSSVARHSVADSLQSDQQALKLLKEFWTAVERGVLARKGRTLSIAGRVGNVDSVKDGQVTLKVGAKEYRQPLLGLDARQASAIADLTDDEHGNLTRAIFLIAEASQADAQTAAKSLAAAGNPPGLAIYKDRLDALTLGAAEVAARRAWAEIEALAKGKLSKTETQRLLALLDAFEKAHANTKHFTAVREKLAHVRADAQAALEATGKQPPMPSEWVSLFDGKSLDGWRVEEGGEFSGKGSVRVREGQMVLQKDKKWNGIAWTREFPNEDYELCVVAKRVGGGDDFATTHFPVGSSDVALTVGGSYGRVVALNLVDGKPSWDNATTRTVDFQDGRWYRIRVRVSQARIEAWIDDKKMIGIAREGHTIGSSPRAGVPLAIHAANCTSAIRSVMFRRLTTTTERPVKD